MHKCSSNIIIYDIDLLIYINIHVLRAVFKEQSNTNLASKQVWTVLHYTDKSNYNSGIISGDCQWDWQKIVVLLLDGIFIKRAKPPSTHARHLTSPCWTSTTVCSGCSCGTPACGIFSVQLLQWPLDALYMNFSVTMVDGTWSSYVVILLFYWRGNINDASQLPLNLNGLMTQLLTAQKGNWSVCGKKKSALQLSVTGFPLNSIDEWFVSIVPKCWLEVLSHFISAFCFSYNL